jgi:hypothetical protein
VTRPARFLEALATVVGSLAAVALGLSAGAMLAEGAVLVPWWRSMPPEAFLGWYAGNASRLFDFFAPLEIASTVLAVVAGASYRYHRGGGGLFVVAAVLAVAVLGAFPLYFARVNASFAAGTIEVDRVAGELARWAAWHWSRTAIGIAACGAAVLGVRAAR